MPYSIHSSYLEILELVRRVRPIRVVPIVPASPCPFAALAPLLDSERQLPPVVLPPGLAAPRRPAPALVAKRERETKLDSKPLLLRGRRKRIGVSDERVAQIATVIARNSERLGIRAKHEERNDAIDVDAMGVDEMEEMDEIDEIEEDEEDENDAPSGAQLMAMFERSRAASQQQSL